MEQAGFRRVPLAPADPRDRDVHVGERRVSSRRHAFDRLGDFIAALDRAGELDSHQRARSRRDSSCARSAIA